MVSSLELVIRWTEETLGIQAGTYPPKDAAAAVPGAAPFAVVTRTGGTLSYPHDSPAFAVQIWAADEATAEADAAMLAIACRTKPPTDSHINAVLDPSVLSYGRQDGGWFVWQTDINLEVNLL
nr:MAG TPA: hypothetical protein [Caudoviricetes sp.]